MEVLRGARHSISLTAVLILAALLLLTSCGEKRVTSATVPFRLDHNRMLVDAEFQRPDGSWRKAVLWIDTGNPEFFMSDGLAADLGVDLSASDDSKEGLFSSMDVPAPENVRIGGLSLRFEGVKTRVMTRPQWIFHTMHNDGNLPSTVLKHYDVVFDYPKRELTLAEPGAMEHSGVRARAAVHPETGIVQIDGEIGGEAVSFALDNGASYSFVSGDLADRLAAGHPDWPRTVGAVGGANIWGWWPEEGSWQMLRVPEMSWGPVQLEGVGLVGLPNMFSEGTDLGAWYSKKAARPVAGFLGPNAFKAFRVGIDYTGSAVWFEKGGDFDDRDMDMVGLTLRPEADGTWRVIGISTVDGLPAAENVEIDDILVQVDDLETTGKTMGTVVDALRGEPGETRTLILQRSEESVVVEAKVERIL